MNNLKFLIIILLSGMFVIYYGCESNDSLPTTGNVPPSIDSSKKVMVEFFTNAGCIPCASVHHYFDKIDSLQGITYKDSNVIVLTFHTRYPSLADSIYRSNSAQFDARTTYYGINFTPQGRMDGTDMGQFSASDWTALLNSELQATKYLNINLTNNFIASNDSGVVTSNITILSALPVTTGNVIHVVVTENHVEYITSPNGIQYPNDVVRTMVTGSGGQSITINSGQTTTFTSGYKLLSNWNNNNCYINVFIQNTASKQVFGVQRIKITN